MALNIAVPLSGVGGLAPISPIGVDCWENIKILVSPMGSESSGVSSLDSEEAKIQHLKPTPLTPAKQKIEVILPNREVKIFYNGRDILDLYNNVRTDDRKKWNLSYAKLPEHNMAMYLANRSQYHRLGAHGLTPEYRLLKCQCCDFQYPINRAGTDFTQTSLVTSSTTSAMTFSTANNNCGVGFNLIKNNKNYNNNVNNINNNNNNNTTINGDCNGGNNNINYSTTINRNSDIFDGFFNKTTNNNNNNNTPPTRGLNLNKRSSIANIDADQTLSKSMSAITANLTEILNINSTDTSNTPSPLTLNSFNNSPILNSNINTNVNSNPSANAILNSNSNSVTNLNLNLNHNNIHNTHSNGSNYVSQNNYINNNQILKNNNNNNNHINGINNNNNNNNNINNNNNNNNVNNNYNMTRNNNSNNFYSLLNTYTKAFAIAAASNNTIINNNNNNTVNNNNNGNNNSYFNNMNNSNTPTTPNVGGHFYNNSSPSSNSTINNNLSNNSFNTNNGQHYARMYKYF